MFRSFRSLASITACAALLGISTGSARAEILFGITDSPAASLVSFDSAAPGTLTTVGTISGLSAGHTLRAIDFRPSNGLLYAVSNSGTGTAAQLYTVDLNTAVLTAIGGGFTLTGNNSDGVSIDFNPVADALRVVTGNAQSYRVNATTGALIAQDTSISPNSLYVDVAYSNNVVGAASTTLYTYDYFTDSVGIIGGIGGSPSPNGGQYNRIGRSGIATFDATLGFDISGATGIGYINLNSGNGDDSRFYTADLATGALTFAGSFNTPMRDISVRAVSVNPPSTAAPEPGSLALVLPVIGAVGLVLRKRRRR